MAEGLAGSYLGPEFHNPGTGAGAWPVLSQHGGMGLVTG